MQQILHPMQFMQVSQVSVLGSLLFAWLKLDVLEKQLVCSVQAGMPGLRPTADSPLQRKDAVCLPSMS